jgi:hypothetical protein
MKNHCVANRRDDAFIFWLLWVGASALGCALGATIFHAQEHYTLKALSGPLALIMAFILPAVLQSLVLRLRVTRSGWWILVSSVGSLLSLIPLAWGLAVADTQGQSTFARVAVPAAFALSGAVMGTCEWLALRRWFRHAGWWILFRSVAALASIDVFSTLTRGADVHFLLGGAASGGISAAITGLLLAWLLRKHGKPSPTEHLGSTPHGRPQAA